MTVRGEQPIKVGILGLTNPGIAIWDKANVEGKMIIDWVTSHGVIDPPTFAKMDWRLVSGGAAVQINGWHDDGSGRAAAAEAVAVAAKPTLISDPGR